MQAAWTPVEVGELGELAGADIVVDPADLELDPESEAELAASPPTVRRNVEHLRTYAATPPAGKSRAIRLRFFTSPVAILGDGKVEAIELARNELVGGRAVQTDERETIACGVVFRSVGYHGVPVPGVSFDEGSGTVPNEGGRVEPGVYAAGWIKRGPSGVIGTNKKDATETVQLLLAGRRGRPAHASGRRVAGAAPGGARGRSGALRGLGGDRSRRANGRRAARPPARQARARGTTCSRPVGRG